ncbi:hypothetical protein BT69DRAFT_1138614 [Atractiella rhizophila]|nr:hypothetical protein BT69DRAFT_1138614 [Atractiella rhizophila]
MVFSSPSNRIPPSLTPPSHPRKMERRQPVPVTHAAMRHGRRYGCTTKISSFGELKREGNLRAGCSVRPPMIGPTCCIHGGRQYSPQ